VLVFDVDVDAGDGEDYDVIGGPGHSVSDRGGFLVGCDVVCFG
jgi:hypothetical protein